MLLKKLSKLLIFIFMVISTSKAENFSSQTTNQKDTTGNYYYSQIGNFRDTAKVQTILVQVSDLIYSGRNEYSLKVINRIQKKAIQEKNNFFIAHCDMELAISYGFLGDFDKAIKTLNHAIEQIKYENGFSISSLRASIYNNLGSVYLDLGSYSKAVEFLKKSLQLSTKYGLTDSERLSILNMGTALLLMDKYDRALIYFKKALKLAEKEKDKESQAGILYNIGIIYSNTNKIDSALICSHKSEFLFKEIGNKIQESRLKTFQSNLKLKIGDTLGAISLIEDAIRISTLLNDSSIVAFGKQKLAIYLNFTGKFKKSIKLADESLKYFLEKRQLEYIKSAYEILSDSYFKLKNYKLAYEYGNLRQLYTDTIAMQDVSAIISKHEIDQAAEENKQKMAIFKINNESEIRKKDTFIIIISVSILVLLIIFLLTLKLYQSKKKANKLLTEVNATKDKFFTIISHDLKTPIASLKNLSELLSEYYEEFDEKEKIQHLSTLKDSSSNVLKLLENLLIWSRLQTNKINFNPETINLNKLIESELENLRPSIEFKNIDCKIDVSQEQTAFVDEYMIRTVLRNLISNAIKFTPLNGTISVSTSQDNEFIEIDVADSGIGIKDEDKEKLFRLDIKHSTLGTLNEKGTGLGLNLCKEFIEKHNGKIWFESVFGQGTSFKFKIPNLTIENV